MRLGKVVDKMAIINGYAQNESLYKSNNRILEIANHFLLKDNILDYQYIPVRGTNIQFTGIYEGSKYNDTCIAELNFICSGGNYLFGEINE